MKKLNTLITILSMIGLFLLPQIGNAEMVSLSDDEMRAVTGQAGITFTAEDHVDFDMNIDTLAFGDDDGIDTNGGYLSLNDITLIGSADFDSPVSVAITTEMDPFQNNGMLTGLNLEMSGMEIKIDEFSVGAITVGSNPGEGKSFGSISMTGYHAQISGKLRITTH